MKNFYLQIKIKTDKSPTDKDGKKGSRDPARGPHICLIGPWKEKTWNASTDGSGWKMCETWKLLQSCAAGHQFFFLTCVFKNKVNHKQQIRLELHLNVWLSLVSVRWERFPVWHFQPQMCVWQMNSQQLNTRPGKSQTSRHRKFFTMEVFVFTCWALNTWKLSKSGTNIRSAHVFPAPTWWLQLCIGFLSHCIM